MIEITGAYNTAKVFIDAIDETTRAQIALMCDQDYLVNCRIRVMPDTHAGKGCTIGTTMTLHDKVVPNMVGVDIGCGMETAILDEKSLDLEGLDRFIRANIPAGMEIREHPHAYQAQADLRALRCFGQINEHRARHSIGTLGGGNHFIEVDRDDEGTLYLVIHSGSRHLGTEVARWYQDEGYRALSGSSRRQLQELMETLKAQGRFQEIETALREARKRRPAGAVAPDLAYVEGDLFDDYLHDMKLTQRFALLNRKAMLGEIVQGLGLTVRETISTIHNYIDTDAMILRKGAVSAQKGERLLIPINMRDGSLLCVGRGNEDWNCSAPHGAGRLMSRHAAASVFTVEEFCRSMEGIYTTSVGRDTLDECPMAYKDMSAIVDNIGPTAEIKKIIRPIYNFKAGER
ncbi:RtcB family protein [Lawsonibacter faecis]|uniref:3'-phosphate/5'-hydroxy nucleic acid ligase n=1 Tax=Lawsonibacter faecis TaxID=2763052 RepID=A0A8J6J3C2_9FIRM|nr:RtcB family protein [Lawsonibacter faecis]MBC5735472.1 RtcB family protein [Lawsonibacter faecis]